MTKRLLVAFLVLSALAVLAACGGGTQGGGAQDAEAAPVELEVASALYTVSDAARAELLDPEFGCGGGGTLEYGDLYDPADWD